MNPGLRTSVIALLCTQTTWVSGCTRLTSCVAEGTRIITPDGPRAVETLAVGDAVLTQAASGEIQAGRVTHVRSAMAPRVLKLTMDDGRGLCVTAEHPVFIDGRWVPAGELSEGMSVLGTGRSAQITDVHAVSAPTRVFDLTVSPNECFFAENVLVHNKTVVSPPTETELLGTWVYRGHDGCWHRLDLEPQGKGKAWRAHEPFRRKDGERFVTTPIELVSWRLRDREIKVTMKTLDGGVTTLKGKASREVILRSGSFTLEGMLVERPEQASARLRRTLELLADFAPTSDPAPVSP